MPGTGARADTAASLPSKIGRHQVVGYIAAGGMAELYLAKEPTGRPVVIKRILPHLARQSSFVSMFIDEARIGSRAKHPNLVEVHELGQVGSDLFLVMEYLVGENLAGIVRRLVRRTERISYGLCAWIIAEVCDGLHAAHELTDDAGNILELVHRDVSPQNVFVTYGGDVKLLDFGIATAAQRLAHTASGELKGKYAYMSPEQCRGEPLDRRSDIFSLGVVLYELSTQRRLFRRASELQMLKAITEDPIPRPGRQLAGYPPALEAVCVRALARDPAQRYATAADMREALLAAIPELGLEGDPHEALASKSARLFADRMAQKHELLERVRRGADLSDLLVPEVDEGVEVPVVSSPSDTALSDVRGVRSRRRSRGRALAFGAALVAALAGGAGVGAYVKHRRRAAAPPGAEGLPAAARPVDAGASRAAPAPLDPPAVTPDAAPDGAAQRVVVTVETEPSGVEVVIGGQRRGKTPVGVTLDRSEAPVRLELLEPGFETASQPIVPDRDQRLYFQLIKQKRRTIVRTRQPAAEKGFRRFD